MLTQTNYLVQDFPKEYNDEISSLVLTHQTVIHKSFVLMEPKIEITQTFYPTSCSCSLQLDESKPETISTDDYFNLMAGVKRANLLPIILTQRTYKYTNKITKLTKLIDVNCVDKYRDYGGWFFATLLTDNNNPDYRVIPYLEFLMCAQNITDDKMFSLYSYWGHTRIANKTSYYIKRKQESEMIQLMQNGGTI